MVAVVLDSFGVDGWLLSLVRRTGQLRPALAVAFDDDVLYSWIPCCLENNFRQILVRAWN